MWYTLLLTLVMSSDAIAEHTLVGVCHTKRVGTMKASASAIPLDCSSSMTGKRRINLMELWYRNALVWVGIPLLGICTCAGIEFLAPHGTKGCHWPPRLQNTNSPRIFPIFFYVIVVVFSSSSLEDSTILFSEVNLVQFHAHICCPVISAIISHNANNYSTGER